MEHRKNHRVKTLVTIPPYTIYNCPTKVSFLMCCRLFLCKLAHDIQRKFIIQTLAVCATVLNYANTEFVALNEACLELNKTKFVNYASHFVRH